MVLADPDGGIGGDQTDDQPTVQDWATKLHEDGHHDHDDVCEDARSCFP